MSLWMPVNDVAGEQATIAAAKTWRSKLFTSSTTWTVPPDVGCLWVDGCASGSGGGGGDPTPGGGGGGGCAGFPCQQLPLAVTPGETLTLTIGAGGAGGVVGQDGAMGGETTLARADDSLAVFLPAGGNGLKGANPNGGSGGGAYHASHWGAFLTVAAGGAGAGGAGAYVYAPKILTGWSGFAPMTGGSAGGALSNAGGVAYGAKFGVPQVWNGSALVGANPTTGNASGGGGGTGGANPFGYPGKGGSNGAAGAHAVGYGCGGGGGSGNSAGGNGSPGMIRIYCFTAYEI